MKKFLMLVVILTFSFDFASAMKSRSKRYLDLKIKNIQDEKLLFEIKDLVSQLSRSEKAQLLKIVCSNKSTTNNGKIAVEVIDQCNCRLTIGNRGNITTPLHVALRQDKNRFNILSLVKILIRAGADVVAADSFGITPYCEAVIRYSSQDVINELCEARARRDLRPLRTTKKELVKQSIGFMNF